MSGLLGQLTPQQQATLSLMQGTVPSGWSLAQQNALPGMINPMSGLPTANGVALQAAAPRPSAAPGAAPVMGQPPPQAPGFSPMGPLAAAQLAARTQQQNVYGGGQPLSDLHAGLLGAAGFPSFEDPRLIADSLATAAQQPGLDPDELQKRQDAFMRYMNPRGGGGYGGGSGGGEGGSDIAGNAASDAANAEINS